MTAPRTGVPMELERITGKCLVKGREKRYQSIADLLLDLETLREKLKSGKSAILRTGVATGTHAGPADGGARHALPPTGCLLTANAPCVRLNPIRYQVSVNRTGYEVPGCASEGLPCPSN